MGPLDKLVCSLGDVTSAPWEMTLAEKNLASNFQFYLKQVDNFLLEVDNMTY